jgi:DNA-binding transcriptional ArsR family regulator
MSTNDVASALFSRTRAGVLAVLALAPELELHVREVARRAKLDASGVMRELRLLERHGILASRRAGRQKLYRMNQHSPLYAELSSIMRKTTGLADLIRQDSKKAQHGCATTNAGRCHASPGSAGFSPRGNVPAGLKPRLPV